MSFGTLKQGRQVVKYTYWPSYRVNNVLRDTETSLPQAMAPQAAQLQSK